MITYYFDKLFFSDKKNYANTYLILLSNKVLFKIKYKKNSNILTFSIQ